MSTSKGSFECEGCGEVTEEFIDKIYHGDNYGNAGIRCPKCDNIAWLIPKKTRLLFGRESGVKMKKQQEKKIAIGNHNQSIKQMTDYLCAGEVYEQELTKDEVGAFKCMECGEVYEEYLKLITKRTVTGSRGIECITCGGIAWLVEKEPDKVETRETIMDMFKEEQRIKLKRLIESYCFIIGQNGITIKAMIVNRLMANHGTAWYGAAYKNADKQIDEFVEFLQKNIVL